MTPLLPQIERSLARGGHNTALDFCVGVEYSDQL
jgi:hypothetical protein